MIKIRPAHLKARLVISLILLIFSTLGVFIAVFAPSFAWHYWLLIVPIFAILCIWLSWHVARKHNLSSNVIWHEVIHWLALLVAVYLVSVIVNAGIINYLAGALFILILLALVIFLAGVHFDPMFMLIGILLGLLAVCSALFVKYLIVIMIPAVLIIAILLVWRFTYKKKAEE
ncbi:MAG: hypothetical protein A3E87_05890 [Gammaproteobacteria bacterium RIFCSPHIGHO2_12_FULL_35_23]|nr:MAG: hypothetical protein A3E87_05890 [Gammaproteobacteria bacterium RIFCSPHIGHO2_12_FULL_35_23]